MNCSRIAEHARLVAGGIVTESVIHIGAVEEKIIGAAAGSVHGKRTERARRVGNLIWRASHAGVQVNELGVVASVHRQILDGIGGESAAKLGGGRLDVAEFLARNFDSL